MKMYPKFTISNQKKSRFFNVMKTKPAEEELKKTRSIWARNLNRSHLRTEEFYNFVKALTLHYVKFGRTAV